MCRPHEEQCHLPSGDERKVLVLRVSVVTDGVERPVGDDGVRVRSVEQTQFAPSYLQQTFAAEIQQRRRKQIDVEQLCVIHTRTTRDAQRTAALQPTAAKIAANVLHLSLIHI